jgi:hypothetical protein
MIRKEEKDQEEGAGEGKKGNRGRYQCTLYALMKSIIQYN